MKFSKVLKGSFGKKSIRGLLDDGTILGVIHLPNAGFAEISYFINNKPVKNKGASNKVFSRNIENFSLLLKKLCYN